MCWSKCKFFLILELPQLYGWQRTTDKVLRHVTSCVQTSTVSRCSIMYADLKIVEFHTLLMQIMIKVQIKFCLLRFYLFIYSLTDFVDLSFALLLFLPCAVLTPALQTSLCQIKSLRAASIPSTERISVFFTGAWATCPRAILWPAHHSTPPLKPQCW